MFKFVREEPEHFVAKGGQGEFRVAKSRLYPATADRIRMALGGVVRKADGGPVSEYSPDVPVPPKGPGLQALGGTGVRPDTKHMAEMLLRGFAEDFAGRPGTIRGEAMNRIMAGGRSVLPSGGSYADEMKRVQLAREERAPGVYSVVPEVRTRAMAGQRMAADNENTFNAIVGGAGAILPKAAGAARAARMAENKAVLGPWKPGFPESIARAPGLIEHPALRQAAKVVGKAADQGSWLNDLYTHLKEGLGEGEQPVAFNAPSMIPAFAHGGDAPIHAAGGVLTPEDAPRDFMGNPVEGVRSESPWIQREFLPQIARSLQPVAPGQPALPPAAPPMAAPAARNAGRQLPDVGGPAAAAAPRTARPGPSPMDPYAQLLQQMQPPAGALQAIGRAEQQRGLAESDAARSQQEWVNTKMQWSEDARAKIDKEYQDSVDDYKNQKIDPMRVWHDKGAPAKAATLLGMVLSGMGSGLTGQPNLAVQLLQRQIELDTEAQVRTMDQKKNLVSMNFEKYGNLDQAIRETYMQKAAGYEAQLHQIAASSTAAEAMPRAQMALYQLRQPLIPIMLQMAQYQGLNNFIRSGGHMVGDMPAPWTWEQYETQAMPGPNGSVTFARPGMRDKAVEGMQKWNAFGREIAGLEESRSALAALPVIPTEAKETYNQHRQATLFALAEAVGNSPGREAMLKRAGQIIPGDIMQFIHGSQSFDALKEIHDNGLDSIWETHGSLHRPRGEKIPPKSPAALPASGFPAAGRTYP